MDEPRFVNEYLLKHDVDALRTVLQTVVDEEVLLFLRKGKRGRKLELQLSERDEGLQVTVGERATALAYGEIVSYFAPLWALLNATRRSSQRHFEGE